MLRKLIWKNSSKLQLGGATFGAMFGMFLLLLAFQLYFDATELLTHDSDNLFAEDILIINKKVSTLNTLKVADSEFTKSELNDMKKQPFIKSVEPFISGQYDVQVKIKANKNTPLLNTDIFFEAVRDDLMDIDKTVWKWSERDRYVPLIIPSDWINLYNFAYAPSQGAPQISKDLIKQAYVEIIFRLSNKERFVMDAKIVGFSDKLNSFMVPMSFMEWSNNKFGDEEVKRPTRVVLVADDISNPKLLEFLIKNNYETKKDNLKTSKLNLLLRVTMAIMSGISLVIIVLSILIFILSFQLLIVKSREEIRLLIHLGYHPYKIEKFLGVYLLGMSAIIGVLSLIGVAFSKSYIGNLIVDYGFELSIGLNGQIYLLALALLVILLVINFVNIRRGIRKYA